MKQKKWFINRIVKIKYIYKKDNKFENKINGISNILILKRKHEIYIYRDDNKGGSRRVNLISTLSYLFKIFLILILLKKIKWDGVSMKNFHTCPITFNIFF